MRKLATIVLLAGGLIAPAAMAQDVKKPEGQKETLSYAFGMHFVRNLDELGVLDKVDLDLVMQAIQDKKDGIDARITQEEGDAAFTALQEMLQAEAAAVQIARAAEAQERGETFLAENGKKDGITTTESGVQYRVLTAVEEGPSPTLENSVLAHYTGTLLDGTKFDSSVDRGEPVEFPVGGVIKGWTEVLQLMKAGEKWEVWIPSALAYGERGAGQDIGPNEVLRFEIELIEIK